MCRRLWSLTSVPAELAIAGRCRRDIYPFGENVDQSLSSQDTRSRILEKDAVL